MNDKYRELIRLCNENSFSDNDIELVDKAFKYASKVHDGMIRRNGDDYILHPLEVALVVAEMHADVSSVVASLVSETVKHGNVTYDDLRNNFGEDVALIVNSLDQINRLHLADEKESSSLYLRKVLVALSKDVRVIVIKLAGRLHDMRTIEGLDPESRYAKALETWNVLIPIAHRLGMYQIKSELEDCCFKILKAKEQQEIEATLPRERKVLEEMLDNVKEDIIDILITNNIKFEIKGRVKSDSSIYNKFQNGKTWNTIYDILGLRIICESESDCYLIIGLIHSLFRPISGRFKDYIAMPKGNSYQSLHTGIYGPEGLPVEVQVRTKEMNEIAEHGIASHWSYKEKNSRNIQNVMEQKLQMFRNIIESNASDIQDDDVFANDVSFELLNKSIYVYTPNGDVVELPDAATPIDFAYRIHSHVGDTCVGAIVNDQIVALDYTLKDNDVVKILTNNNSTPSKEWLNIVKTTQAKSKLKSYFSKKDKEEYEVRGKELLLAELRKQKVSISEALSDEHVNKLLKDLKVGSIEEVYLSIGSMRYTPIYIYNLLFEDKKDVSDLLLDKVMNKKVNEKINYKNDVIVSGCADLLVNLASCCTPVAGDEIIGYITKGQGITVHKKDCINIRDVKTRLINVEWNNKNIEDKKYLARLSVETNEINNRMIDIVSIASARNIAINSINELNRNGILSYELIVKVNNKNDLDDFISSIASLSFVKKVKRY